MVFDQIDSGLKFYLKNTAKHTVEESVEYSEVLSPFSRLYYIEAGSGFLFFNEKKVELKAGNIYLIPSYTYCTYSFNAGMSHYYIHFVNSLESGFNLYDLFTCSDQVVAKPIDKSLFAELIEYHPDMGLVNNDPEVYQKKTWIHKAPEYGMFSNYLLTNSIIGHLLARFICAHKKSTGEHLTQRELLKPILAYIYENLNTEIKVSTLANMASLSKDHFTKVFKVVTDLTPNDYINRKRIEKAQVLLVSTGLSQKDIMERCGFNSLSYFSRMFTRYTKTTPGEFKRNIH